MAVEVRWRIYGCAEPQSSATVPHMHVRLRALAPTMRLYSVVLYEDMFQAASARDQLLLKVLRCQLRSGDLVLMIPQYFHLLQTSSSSFWSSSGTFSIFEIGFSLPEAGQATLND